MQQALGVGGSLNRGAAGGQPHRQRRTVAGRSGLGELVAAQGLASCSGGIQRVRFGAAAAGGPLGPVQLHHLLSLGLKEPGQAGAIAASALDRPHPPTSLSIGQPQQLLVAGWSRRHGGLIDHGAGGGPDDRRCVGVLVSVDPDDELDEVRQHGHALTPCPDVDVTVGPGRSTAGL